MLKLDLKSVIKGHIDKITKIYYKSQKYSDVKT